jgi:Na+-driven multidrug efflux pump
MSVTWSVAGAVGQATATGVGQNLGANTPDRAWRVTYVATAGTMGLLGAAAAVCLLFPRFMLGIFVDDPAVITEGVGFLYIIAPFWAAFGGTMVIQGAFRGAGQTKVAMALSFLSRWVFRVPVAIVVAFSAITVPGTDLTVPTLGVGVEGIWIAFAVGAALSFVIAVVWFRLGRWQDTVIDESRPDPAVESESVDDDAAVRDVD